MRDLEQYISGLCAGVKSASRSFNPASTALKNAALSEIAEALGERDNITAITAANALDLENPDVPPNMLDRLRLDEKRIAGIVSSLRELIALPDPVGGGERWVRPNGLTITRARVPLGVIAIIYESRPNVTVDAAALCLKAGNAVILRGGKEAIRTNRALISVMKTAVERAGVDPDVIGFVDDVTREGTGLLMKQRGYIDVLIPRGGRSLIRSVVENSSVPVIETGAGNCHIYIDKSAGLDMALKVAINAKVSRPSVCNAVETMLVHSAVAREFLPMFAAEAEKYRLELRGCEKTRAILPGIAEATETDYMTEYDDMILAVKIVEDEDEAIAHINRYNTGHSESIITGEIAAAEKFKRNVDAAAVYVNASTRFTDGGEFGFGAEIGISTQKLHARGPMGLTELTTVKYLVDGDGQIRV